MIDWLLGVPAYLYVGTLVLRAVLSTQVVSTDGPLDRWMIILCWPFVLILDLLYWMAFASLCVREFAKHGYRGLQRYLDESDVL